MAMCAVCVSTDILLDTARWFRPSPFGRARIASAPGSCTSCGVTGYISTKPEAQRVWSIGTRRPTHRPRVPDLPCRRLRGQIQRRITVSARRRSRARVCV